MTKPMFSTPDLTTFARLDTLDLTCIDQHITAHNAILKCRPNPTDSWCRRCGGHGDIRDTVLRRLAHETFGHRPTTLHIRLHRYKCIVYSLSESRLLELTGDVPESPTFDLPCREVIARGQRDIEVLGPLLEDEAAAAHEGFWTRRTDVAQ